MRLGMTCKKQYFYSCRCSLLNPYFLRRFSKFSFSTYVSKNIKFFNTGRATNMKTIVTLFLFAFFACVPNRCFSLNFYTKWWSYGEWLFRIAHVSGVGGVGRCKKTSCPIGPIDGTGLEEHLSGIFTGSMVSPKLLLLSLQDQKSRCLQVWHEILGSVWAVGKISKTGFSVLGRFFSSHCALEKGPNAKKMLQEFYIPHELLHCLRGLVTEVKVFFSDEIVRY